MADNQNIHRQAGDNSGFEFKDVLDLMFRLRFFIIASVVLALAVAVAYVKLKNPEYKRTAQIMLSSESSQQQFSEANMLSEISGVRLRSNINNEMYILRSVSLMKRVVDDLGLNKRYYTDRFSFPFFKNEFYLDSPFSFDVSFDPLYSEHSLPTAISFSFVPSGDSLFTLSVLQYLDAAGQQVSHELGKQFKYGVSIPFEGFNLLVSSTNTHQLEKGRNYYASWITSYAAATEYAKKLEVASESGNSSRFIMTDVITLAIQDSKIQRSDDILNTLISEFNRDARDIRSESIESTLEFLENRLSFLSNELGNVESSFVDYQSSRSLVDLNAQSQLTLSSDMEYEKQLTEIRLQSSILQMIRDDIEQNSRDAFKVIPSNVGLSDSNLNSFIGNYNMLVAERNRLVSNSSESNPRVRNLDQQLSDVRGSIVVSVENLVKVYHLREIELENVLRKSRAKMSSIPTQQYDLNRIERKQQIIEPLYLLLQQKREEAQMAICSVTDKARIIEPPYGDPAPVAPNSRQVLIIAFLLGLFLPPGISYVRSALRTVVSNKDDITRNTAVPVIASIPKSSDRGIIKPDSRDPRAEAFRILRANMRYVTGKVIQVTSTMPGEGKSFIAANLAISISHAGKKVALLGLDLRKQSLSSLFPEMDFSSGANVIDYLIGNMDSPQDIIRHYNSSLDIAFPGSVPPNPAEILSGDKLKGLVDWFRENYDYVICDSAPFIQIADSSIINAYVDSTFYVVRAGLTKLKTIRSLDEIFSENDIKAPKIVLNSVDNKSLEHKYGYGLSYGYYPSRK